MNKLRRRRSRIVAPCPIAWGHNRETGVTNRGGAVCGLGSRNREVFTVAQLIVLPSSNSLTEKSRR
jgi:hypothetical protein